MDSLSRLFGSPARLKLLRLFFFNQGEAFTFSAVVERAKISGEHARHELALLCTAGILRRAGSGKKFSYKINSHFEHLAALDVFMRTTTAVSRGELLQALKKSGTLRFVLLSGFFTGATESQLDLLVVGDRLDERALARTITSLEADLGREIRFAVFSTEDFRYRLGVYDRLIRDVFDYPNDRLLDKIGI